MSGVHLASKKRPRDQESLDEASKRSKDCKQHQPDEEVPEKNEEESTHRAATEEILEMFSKYNTSLEQSLVLVAAAIKALSKPDSLVEKVLATLDNPTLESLGAFLLTLDAEDRFHDVLDAVEAETQKRKAAFLGSTDWEDSNPSEEHIKFAALLQSLRSAVSSPASRSDPRAALAELERILFWQ